MVGGRAWGGISRDAASTPTELGELHRAETRLAAGGGLGGGGQGQRNPKEPCAGSLAPRKALTALGSKAHAKRHSVSAQ